jgi:gamma-glutamylcyclotransferase (GGCT)/AIG2-like uncharacterized protein YtfP
MKLIVYGTLMRGESNHHMMNGAEYLQDVEVPNALLLNLGGYPGLIFLPMGQDHSVVHGELYEIEGNHLSELDRFEGVPHLYDRVECKYRVKVSDGYVIGAAYIYEYQDDTDNIINTGNWKER